MKNKQKIKEYFFKNPLKKLRVRQIEREAKVALPSVIRYVKELEKESILKSEVIAGVKLYSTAWNSKKYHLEKSFFNINSLYVSGLMDFLEKEYSNPIIVLFGSYLNGYDDEESDIDIFIQSSVKKAKNIEKFEQILGKEIQIFFHKSIHEIKNKHFVNSIANGLVLNGCLEIL